MCLMINSVEQCPSLESNGCPTVLETPSILHKAKFNFHVQNTLRLIFIRSHKNPSKPFNHIFLTTILILFSHPRAGLTFFQVSTPQSYMIFCLIPCAAAFSAERTLYFPGKLLSIRCTGN